MDSCSEIARSRSLGSPIDTGSPGKIPETRLLKTPRSEFARTETGTRVRTTRLDTSSPRCSSRVRKPAVMAASTTSFTVPPRPWRMVFTSTRLASAQLHRRCGPIGPLSDVADRLPHSASERSSTAPSARRVRGPAVRRSAPEKSRRRPSGSAMVRTTPRAARVNVPGSASGVQSSGAVSAAGVSKASNITVSRSVAETPSTMQ